MRRTLALLSFMVAASLSTAGQLMVVNSGTDSVWLLNDFDGSVISENFIVDTARFSTAKHAIDSGRGTVLVSDQISDSVFEYGMNGAYIGTIASLATHGIDNIRGIAVRNGQLYITVGGGTHVNTIQRINLDGTGQTTWANSHVDSPFDIQFRTEDVLVSNSGSDDIERYDLSGNWLGSFHSSDGVSTIDFPQQISLGSGGSVLAAGFSAPAGVYRYDSAGTQLNYFNPNLALRGVYQLGNGKILFTGGTDIRTVDPTTGAFTTIVSRTGLSFQYIEAAPVPEPGTMMALGAGLALFARRRRAR